MQRRGLIKSLAWMMALPFVAKAIPVQKCEHAYGVEDFVQYRDKVKVDISVPLDSLPPEAVKEISRLIGIPCAWQTEAEITKRMLQAEMAIPSSAPFLAQFNQET